MKIKQLKPKKSSHYKQGYINPDSCNKLFESVKREPIIYRSSWEKKFITWCENCSKVKHWGSECIGIKYFNVVDKQEHTYYPDFVLEMTNGQKVIVEIKPSCQTEKPDIHDQYNYRAWLINMSKWSVVSKKCEDNGYKFWILTEKTINKL